MQLSTVGEARPARFFRTPQLDLPIVELLKWIGLCCMLADHFAVYTLRYHSAVAEAFGSLALPLFAVAMGIGLASGPVDRGWRVLRRLLCWAVVAQFALLLVRTVPVGNVLFTIALGLWGYLELVADRRSWWRALLALATLTVCGVFVEFFHFGILFVLAVVWWIRARTWLTAGLVALGLLWLGMPNQNSWALAAVPLVLLVACVPLSVARIPHLFYAAYALQFPALWVLRLVLP